MKDFIASKATLEVELLDELTQIVEHPSYEISSSNFYKLNTWKHKILENKGLVSCKTKAKVTYDNKVEQHIKINREPLAPYGTMLTIPIKTRASPSIRKPESSTHFLEYGFKRPSRLLPLKALRVFAFNTETPVKIKEFEIIIHIPRDYKVMDYQAIHPAKKKKSTLNFELNNLSPGTTFWCLIILAPKTSNLPKIFKKIVGFIIGFIVEKLIEKSSS